MTHLQTILHVEDDPDILDVARMSLTAVGGYEVRQFSSGTAAVAAAPTLRADLLVLDMMMPEMNGLETLAELRKQPHLTHTPVILCTAKTVGLPDAALARQLGLIGTITKPFDAMKLPNQLQQMWSDAANRDAPGPDSRTPQPAGAR